MNTISEYVSNMFSSLPQTKEAVEMRLHITENMEEKYEALLRSGMNEKEALGTVISEFGSMDEIRSELGLSSPSARNLEQPAGNPEEREKFRTKFAIGISIGVACMILAVASWSFLDFLGEGFQILIFFSLIAVGVGLCIYFGIRNGKYEKAEQSGTKEDPVAEAICGIIMCGATIAFLLLGFLKEMWHPGWIVFPVGGILCAIVNTVFSFRKSR